MSSAFPIFHIQITLSLFIHLYHSLYIDSIIIISIIIFHLSFLCNSFSFSIINCAFHFSLFYLFSLFFHFYPPFFIIINSFFLLTTILSSSLLCFLFLPNTFWRFCFLLFSQASLRIFLFFLLSFSSFPFEFLPLEYIPMYSSVL